VIFAGRRINDNMGFYVAAQVVKLMAQKGIAVACSRILVMGLAFKENCPDVRNTRVVDIVSDLASYSAQVDVCDPCVNPEEARHEYGISPIAESKPVHYDAIVIAVIHRAPLCPQAPQAAINFHTNLRTEHTKRTYKGYRRYNPQAAFFPFLLP